MLRLTFIFFEFELTASTGSVSGAQLFARTVGVEIRQRRQARRPPFCSLLFFILFSNTVHTIYRRRVLVIINNPHHGPTTGHQ